MKKSNVSLGMSIGFTVLAIVSCFVEIPVQIVTTLSICSLLFTAAQAIHSFISECDEENMEKFELFKDMGNFKIDKKWDFVYKKYLSLWTNNKKQKAIEIISNIMEILAFIILLFGLIVPLKWFEKEWVSNLCTFMSFGFLFFSIWLVEIVKKRTKVWNELRLMYMLLKDNSENSEEKID